MSIIGESLNQNCRFETPTYFSDDLPVLIMKVYDCKNQFNISGGKFIEISKGNKNYFVKPENIDFDEENF